MNKMDEIIIRERERRECSDFSTTSFVLCSVEMNEFYGRNGESIDREKRRIKK